MPDPLNIAALGLIHDHIGWNLDSIEQYEHTRLVAVADPHEPLTRQITEKCGSHVRSYSDPLELLGQENIDAALICDSNAGKVPLIEACAERGIPVVTEKPLANNLASANRVFRACEQANVKLMVNWPSAWRAPLWTAYRMATDGMLGTIYQIRYRNAHAGPREMGCSEYFCQWLYDAELNGPGAFIDYTCYGAAFCRLLLGIPDQVTSFTGRLIKTDIDVEDNAVLLLQYPQAICIVEASWTQVVRDFHHIIIRGTQGTAVVRDHDVLHLTPDSPQGTVVPTAPLPKTKASLAANFYHHVVHDEPLHEICDPRIARDAQAIMEAGYRAAQTGRAQEVAA